MSKTSPSRTKKKSKTRAQAAPSKKPVEQVTEPAEFAAEVATPASGRRKWQGLEQWHFRLTFFFVIEAALILLLATTQDVTVTGSYAAQDSLAAAAGHPTLVAATHRLFDVNIGFLVTAILWLAALGHGFTLSVYRKRAAAELAQGINRLRWIEYMVTGPLILVTLALVGGIYDFAMLLMIAVLTIAALALGLLLELRDAGKRTTKWGLWYVACLLGCTPGVVFVLQALQTQVYGATNLPGYVYWTGGTLLVLFAANVTNLYLQRVQRGKWADYLFGERIFMVLGFAAKSTLAWGIFAGLLHP